MDLIPSLTSEERAAVDAALSHISTWITFEKMFSLWSQFVKDVEYGYADSDVEYINDLSIRDLISTLVAALPPATGAKIEESIRPIDERFLSATILSNQAVGAGSAHWWFRVPKVLTGELRSDFQSRGI